MWIGKMLMELLIADKARLEKDIADKVMDLFTAKKDLAAANASLTDARAQKAKDDLTIDWMRHRINALEKQNAILINKAAGVSFPVPEIVPTRPGTLSAPPMDFDAMPSFEDVGDTEAARLGVGHDDHGNLTFSMPASTK